MANAERAKWLSAVDVTVMVIAAAAAAYWAALVLDAPFGGPRVFPYLLIWASAGVAMHRVVAFAERRVDVKWPRRALGALKWLAAVVAPLVLVGQLESAVIDRQFEVASAQLRAVRLYVEGHRTASDAFPDSVAPALEAATPIRRIEYLAGPVHFRLSVNVASIDIDGRSFGYDSESDRWWRRHNDAPSDLPARVFELGEACRRGDGGWECHRYECLEGCRD